MQKSVLITGAAGFIGSHLTDRFLAAGYNVLGVDNFLTGRESNIKHLAGNSQFRFEKANVIERFDFKNPWPGKFSQILHFACPASPVDFAGLSQEILEVDSIGTLNALEYARNSGASFFVASTSEIYGDPLEHPQKEEYWGNVNTIGPRACYDEAKRFSEAATTVYQRKYKLDTRIVRIFNTYGPRMRLDDGRVVPSLCEQALKNMPLTIHGDGSQTRSFCFVSDLIEGIFRLSESKETRPVNIGNPKEYSVKEFAEMVLKVSGKKLPIESLPAREDDPRRRRPDISRAKSVLGWEPVVPLEEGLRKTMAAFQAELEKK
jgi:dTDP-glucose 4,6-dehydratase